MSNTIQIRDDQGNALYPITDASLIIGLENRTGMRVVPVDSLPTASADTVGVIYMVTSTQAISITKLVDGSYSWVSCGTLDDIDLSGYATKEDLDQLSQEIGNEGGTTVFTSADLVGMMWNGSAVQASTTTYDAFILPVMPGQTLITTGSAQMISSGVTFASRPTIGETAAIRTNLTSFGTYTIQEGEYFVLFTVIKSLLGSINASLTATGMKKEIADIASSASPLYGKRILCLGDSLTERKGTNGKGYVEYLAEMTGAEVTRCAMGGALYCRRTGSYNPLTTTPANSAQARAPFDIVSLAEAIRDKDYQYIDAGAAWLLANESLDYSDLVTTIKGVDLSDYDIVTVFAGTNDFAASNTMGAADSALYGQVNGAINIILDAIYAANPALRVFFFTPTVRYLNNTVSDANWGDTWTNAQNLNMRQFADAIVSQMRYNHTPICDFYNTLGWDKRNFANYFNVVAPYIDTTHPNYVGFESIAKRMSAFLGANLY